MTTTLEQAACWVAGAIGKQWPQDKAEVLAMTNDVREEMYDLSVVGWQGTLCVPVRQFNQTCGTCATFFGVSLPNYVLNVLGVYQDDRAIPVVDRWGIYPYDQETLVSCPAFRFIDLGEEHPFLNDPPAGECYKIQLMAKSKADVGKFVTLRYLDANDIERVEEVALQTLRVSTNYLVKSINRNGVSLPLNLVGPVSARTDSGILLSEWQPWEVVPGYRRLRLDGGTCNSLCSVVVHFERRRQRLYSLADPVETDQKLIWENGAKYLRLHKKSSADGNDMANSQKFLASFTAKLEELGRRTRGRTHKRALSFTSNTPRRSGLLRGR
jgi:hypothetical protein